MPRIQPYVSQNQVGGGTVRTGGPANVVDLTGVGRAVMGIDQARTDLQRQQELMSEKLAQDEAAVHATNAMSQAGMYWQERIQQAQTSAPSGAGGFTSGLMKDFESWKEEQLKTAPERAKPLLQKDFARFGQGLHAEAFRFEVGARNQKLLTDNEAGIDGDARLMTLMPGQMGDTLARRLASISVLDMPQEVKGKLAAKARESISFYAGMTLANRDPQEWLTRDPTKDPVKSLMDPKQMASLDDHARAAIARAQSKAMADRDAEVKNAVKMLDDTREFVLSGGVISPEYEQTFRARIAAQPGLAEAADALIKMSREGAGFGSQPLDRQAAALEKFAPGDPQQAKLKADMMTIHNRQQAAYKENPWSAATQYGRVPESAPVKIAAAEQIPGLIDERMKTIGKVETMAGKAVSPIRPEEVSDFTRSIQSLPPDRQGDILGQIGAKMNVRQINELTQQLDKTDRVMSLMLMAGADRTSAGVALATRIRQGSQALADKRVKRDDAALSGWRAEISSIVRGSIGDDAQETAAIDAAYYVRAAMEVEGYQNTVSNAQAVRMVLGGVYERQGVKTITPKGMTENDFDNKLKTYTAERLTGISPKFYIAGKEVSPMVVANRIGEMGLKMEAQGVYVPFHNNRVVSLDPEGTKPLKLEVR
jgi:hypothetical protein